MLRKNKMKIFFIYCFLVIILIKNNIIIKNIKKFLKIVDISVIIPIFNTEKYLSSCLKSVIEQSLPNIEIICVNDGSSDNSLKILKEYKNIDNRLIIINQKNKGPAFAKNYGIKISKGKYLAFMDSDDLYPNNFTLELMLNNTINNNVLICGGGLVPFFNNNNNIIKLKKKSILSFKKYGRTKYYDYQYDYYYQRFIYNKNFIKKNKLYFPNYLRYEDPPFFIKTMAFAEYFYALNNITYYYRIKKNPLIITEKKIIDIFKGLKNSLDISKSMNLYKLYYNILLRLNSNFIINITKKFIKNKELKQIISNIFNNINLDILRKGNFTFIKKEFYNKIII